MTPYDGLRFDEIGYWSEHVYIDAFAGAGVHISKATREFVAGSPQNALLVEPPFREYHFIDLDGAKVENLRQMAGGRKDVFIHEGDCNRILLEKVFPSMSFSQYRRGLCLLDPYGLYLDWEVIEKAGTLKTIDLFLNFPIMDMNRNALWHNPDKVDLQARVRMTSFWGDESWRTEAYPEELGLFGSEQEKATNDEVAEAFRKRLKAVAKFAHVPPPLPMRNDKGAIVYYLFFASQKPVGAGIVGDIFKKYRDKGIR